MTEETKKLKIPPVVFLVAAFLILIAIGIATS
jgi:preprotein translocase subunit Sec61beta